MPAGPDRGWGWQGGGCSWVAEPPSPSPAPKMYLRLFCFVPVFFPPQRTDLIFKVNYCGELFFEVFCFPWEISETIWTPKSQKRPQKYRSNAKKNSRLQGGFAPPDPPAGRGPCTPPGTPAAPGPLPNFCPPPHSPPTLPDLVRGPVLVRMPINAVTI